MLAGLCPEHSGVKVSESLDYVQNEQSLGNENIQNILPLTSF